MATRLRAFELEIFDHTSGRGGKAEGFSVRVARSPVGDLAPPEKARIGPEVRTKLRELARGTLDRDGLVGLGEALGDLLFPPTARDYFFRSRERLSAGESLRVQLRFDSLALSAIPWEYTYLLRPGTDPTQRPLDGFLALDGQTSIVRGVNGTAPPDFDPIVGRPLKLVALFSDPATAEYPRLNLDDEQAKMQEGLAGVANVAATFRSDATPTTLQDVLVGGADIFHFSGHGGFEGELGATRGSQVGKGSIIMLDDTGQPRPLSAEDLALNLSNKGVRLALLGACESGMADGVNPWSGLAAALVRAGIPAVVAMQFKVLDVDVIAFSRAFYKSLAGGQAVDAAVIAGRLAMYNESGLESRDWGVPVLYLGGEQGVLFPAGGGQSAGNGTHVVTQPVSTNSSSVNQTALRNAIVSAYTLDQLDVLCADIEQAIKDAGEAHPIKVSLDMVGGATLPGKVQNLIQYLDGYGYLGYLVRAVRADRPNLSF